MEKRSDGFVEIGVNNIRYQNVVYTIYFHEGAQKYKAKIRFPERDNYAWTSEYDSYYALCDVLDDIIDIYVHVWKDK